MTQPTTATPRLPKHQFVRRATGEVATEALYGDRIVNAVYSSARERAPLVYRLATGRLTTKLLAMFTYDKVLGRRLRDPETYFRAWGMDLQECVEAPEHFVTPRHIFERKIRFWEVRPMPDAPNLVVCPADARVVVGSLQEASTFFIKEKFFRFDDLMGERGRDWTNEFAGGEFAVFRLTPDKYHYNHAPVAGRVVDLFTVEGRYHACNPGAIVAEVTPYSKNLRVVTVIDTDVPNGTGVGLVAMIEVAAMMIGEIVQCYSPRRYHLPRPIWNGMFLRKGLPKSLYRPGSSTDILLFQPGRVAFAEDLLRNQRRSDVSSRLTLGFGAPLVETEVHVREALARATRVAGHRERS